jgi:cell fate (sporulation/competence/biofilm development) regulator YlbF (YheA/YmcA/DUF963 family)
MEGLLPIQDKQMADKPFSNAYVIKETLRHMQNSISISTSKTIARMQEFQGNSEMTKELLTTLANLNRLNNLIKDIRENNRELIGE